MVPSAAAREGKADGQRRQQAWVSELVSQRGATGHDMLVRAGALGSGRCQVYRAAGWSLWFGLFADDAASAGYHHPCRLAHRSSAADMAAITASTTARCTKWVRLLTMTFIP
jgi:hypothetical protein